MITVILRPPEVEMDFTDAQLTGFGGWSVLGRMAERLNLPRALSALSVKQRARGASDAETLWSPIASPAAGNGALSDLDALREDRSAKGFRVLATCPRAGVLGSIWQGSTRSGRLRRERANRYRCREARPAPRKSQLPATLQGPHRPRGVCRTIGLATRVRPILALRHVLHHTRGRRSRHHDRDHRPLSLFPVRAPGGERAWP